MGRISKRKTNAETSNVVVMRKKILKVGIYARLSSDADEKKNESIDVQVEIAKAYIEKNNVNNVEQMEIFDIYQDLGKTGTNFNRDEFNRLMQDIRLRDVNCVIVKDLSRFGRNYLEAGNYIEKIFPFLGVRFIAVADGFDTGLKGGKTDSMATEIKNLVNDMYAKDFSVKARLHLQQRREEGSYVGGPAPYGYQCAWEGKIRKLVPDPNTAPIVRMIYQLMIDKKNYNAVVDELNAMRINPPAIYRQTKTVYCPETEKYHGWDKGSIQRIMKNAIYRGSLEQGKTSILYKNEENRVHKNKSQWVIRENTHEALVKQEIFDQVANIMKDILSKNKSHIRKSNLLPLEENVFDAVLYCGICARKMTRHSYVKEYKDGRVERVESYSCRNSSNSKTDSCPDSNRITKRALTDILIPALRMEFSVYLDKPKKYVEYGKELVEKAAGKYDIQIRTLHLNLERIREEESNTYMAYREGRIEQSAYVELKMTNITKLGDIHNKISELEACKKNLDKVSDKFGKAIRALMKVKSGECITKDMVDALIERINLYPERRVEIIFKYTDDILKGVK